MPGWESELWDSPAPTLDADHACVWIQGTYSQIGKGGAELRSTKGINLSCKSQSWGVQMTSSALGTSIMDT